MAAAQPNGPKLTPQFCFGTVVLRDFLRASRAVDDTITQHLNALVAPSRAGFDPTSTARRPVSTVAMVSSSPTFASVSSTGPSPPACRAFRDAVLFPAWQSRDDVIRYCTTVADAAIQETRKLATPQTTRPTILPSDDRDMQPPITERDDPYIYRQQYAQVDAPADLLAGLMRQEAGIERIVRARSWDVLQIRCGGSGSVVGFEGGWEAALKQWRKREGR